VGSDYHPSADTLFGFAFGGGGTNWQLALSQRQPPRSQALQTGIYAISALRRSSCMASSPRRMISSAIRC
jgi:hypothetical protein